MSLVKLTRRSDVELILALHDEFAPLSLLLVLLGLGKAHRLIFAQRLTRPPSIPGGGVFGVIGVLSDNYRRERASVIELGWNAALQTFFQFRVLAGDFVFIVDQVILVSPAKSQISPSEIIG